MWLDQQRLNANRYLDNYWIHHNVHGALAAIESGLIDLRITRQGMNEQRWFKMGAAGRGLGAGAMSADQLALLMKFAPANAQLVQVHAASTTDDLSSASTSQRWRELTAWSYAPAVLAALRVGTRPWHGRVA